MGEYVVKLKNNIQLDSNIKKYLTPSYIFIPVKIKDNAKLLVKDNSYVYKNDLVIDGKNKYFSSISGKVIGIKDMIFKSGIYTTLVIENDYKEAVRKRKGARKKINEYSKMEAIKLLSNFGYDINNINYRTNVLLVNTIELEPFFNINQILLDKNILLRYPPNK